ncbi:MAG: hypothetical protein HQM14_17940 [SAR324 cluster bacterium]|nr:hypothetical protein [SAR324 cluster bacterium]
MQRVRRVLLMSLLLLFFNQAPLTMGQAPPASNINNLFSIWAKLSLTGYTQSEIETTLEHVDSKLLQKVKHRLRLNVIQNLARMNLKQEFMTSTTQHDLTAVTNKIRMEIRFAGLENDRYLRVMIRNNFGVPLTLI